MAHQLNPLPVDLHNEAGEESGAGTRDQVALKDEIASWRRTPGRRSAIVGRTLGPSSARARRRLVRVLWLGERGAEAEAWCTGIMT
jgi:hypothetical protein